MYNISERRKLNKKKYVIGHGEMDICIFIITDIVEIKKKYSFDSLLPN